MKAIFSALKSKLVFIKNSKTTMQITSAVIISTVFIGFQNCSKNKIEVAKEIAPDAIFAVGNPIVLPPNCLFDGKQINDGESITAYVNSRPDSSGNCTSESRTCNNAALSGSYPYANCSSSGASCLFNGRSIPDGETISAYLNSSVPTGSNCVPQSRTCNNGTLSGNYPYASCTSGSISCLFDGRTIQNGESVTAFLNSAAPTGTTCTQESRTCNNGRLGGTYQYSSCTVGGASSCLFNSRTIPHGGSVTAFESATPSASTTCRSQTRSCNNGVLSGTYAFASCATTGTSCTFNGETILNGQAVVAYQSSTAPCTAQQRVCTNGVLSGTYVPKRHMHEHHARSFIFDCTFNFNHLT